MTVCYESHHPGKQGGGQSILQCLTSYLQVIMKVIMSVNFTGIHLFVVFLGRKKMTIIIMTTLGETVEVSRVRYDCVILTCKKA